MSRFTLVDPEEMPAHVEGEDLVPEELARGRNVSGERRLQHARTHRSWENNPAVHGFHNEAFLRLWRQDVTGLEPRETEFVVLTTARAFRSKLEWNVHVGTGVEAGIDEDDVVAIFDRDYDALEGADAALARYVTEFSAKEVTKPVHDALAGHFDERTVVGIMELAGFYALCCLLVDATGVETVPADERYDHLSFDRLDGRRYGDGSDSG